MCFKPDPAFPSPYRQPSPKHRLKRRESGLALELYTAVTAIFDTSEDE